MKERKELFCGTLDECVAWIIENDPELKGRELTSRAQAALASKRFESLLNTSPGPACSVFNRRKPKREPVINATVRRLTRQTFRVNGVKKNHSRPLWVSLEPGDVISFCPRGTSQRVSVPVASLYNFARFTAARAIANARRAEKAKKRKARK